MDSLVSVGSQWSVRDPVKGTAVRDSGSTCLVPLADVLLRTLLEQALVVRYPVFSVDEAT